MLECDILVVQHVELYWILLDKLKGTSKDLDVVIERLWDLVSFQKFLHLLLELGDD